MNSSEFKQLELELSNDENMNFKYLLGHKEDIKVSTVNTQYPCHKILRIYLSSVY